MDVTSNWLANIKLDDNASRLLFFMRSNEIGTGDKLQDVHADGWVVLPR
jgi:hypothetical protein